MNPDDGRRRTVTETIEATRATIHSARARVRRGKTLAALTQAVLEMQAAKLYLKQRWDVVPVK